MTRIEAIARLRELADKLEGITDDDARLHVALYVHGATTATFGGWCDALDAHASDMGVNSKWCWNADHSLTVYLPDEYRDLLANRDVQVIEIGGAA